MISQGTKLLQTARLSPYQIQLMKILELPLQGLEARVEQELQTNPVLEEVGSDDPEKAGNVSIDEVEDSGEIPAYRLRTSWGASSSPGFATISVKESFLTGIMEQISYREMTDRQKSITEFIVGSLDSNGYLRRDLESLRDDIAFKTGIDPSMEEMEEAFATVRSCDPPGVGAVSIQDCLLLQLKASAQTTPVKDATRILESCFEDFSQHRYTQVCQRLGLSTEDFRMAKSCILKLDPNPAGQNSEADQLEAAQQITPDFVLVEEGDDINIEMPRSRIPELRVNNDYVKSITMSSGPSEKARKEAGAFLRDNVEKAKWFIEAIKQRQNTLLKTMTAILDFQTAFFRSADEADLKPMVLKDIADITGYDISTVSRVVNSKFVETSFGIFPLKYFFSEGMRNSEGEEVSNRELKKALRECIEAEDKKKPLTDEQLVKVMASKGYNLARRTVAKYRDQLGIPSARLRAEI